MKGLHPNRRSTADRRQVDRRRVISLQPTKNGFLAGIIRTPDEGCLAGPAISTLQPMLKLTAAVEALATRLSEKAGRNPERPTCTVEEAAALLGTTAKGIYALHERGKLPRSIGPGRRLVFLREELLQWARRASPSGGNGR